MVDLAAGVFGIIMTLTVGVRCLWARDFCVGELGLAVLGICLAVFALG